YLADFTNADLTGAQLQGALIDSTLLPVRSGQRLRLLMSKHESQ
ncbi:pentapeptide repeat-containing protein, partial [Desulfobulbus sp. US1]|nr:pentapeptide repeat-containing protein [Desulfobulbus sp. US1]